MPTVSVYLLTSAQASDVQYYLRLAVDSIGSDQTQVIILMTCTFMTRTLTRWTRTHNNLEVRKNFRTFFTIYWRNYGIYVFCVFVFAVRSHIMLESGSGLANRRYYCPRSTCSDRLYCFRRSFFSVRTITHEPLHSARWHFVQICTSTTSRRYWISRLGPYRSKIKVMC